jgi:chromosome segregation ATPase
MKKILLFAAGLMILASCAQEKPKVNNAVTEQRDSLEQIISQKNTEIDDMMSTFNQIQDGLQAINEAENRVSLAKAGEDSDNKKESMLENIRFIQTTMRQNRALVNKLRMQLRESSFSNSKLKSTIDELVSQMDAKDKQLQQLRAELDAKDIHIMQQDENIANLNTNVSDLKNESSQKSQTISQQDKMLNSAWFVFGTKSELKEQRIIEDGKVLRSNFNKDYFTKIDIRVDKEIKLYSKSAKMLTSHPSSSYTLLPDNHKQYVLRITNPQAFWGASKYLVILVK